MNKRRVCQVGIQVLLGACIGLGAKEVTPMFSEKGLILGLILITALISGVLIGSNEDKL